MRKNRSVHHYSIRTIIYILLLIICVAALIFLIGFVYPDTLFVRAIATALILAVVSLGITFRQPLRVSGPVIMAVALLGGFRVFEILDWITCLLIISLSIVVFYIVRPDGAV